jgi:hypothetical protein
LKPAQPDLKVPTLVELEACKRMKPVVIRVTFLDRKYAIPATIIKICNASP